jgi:hypothetical protein
MTSITITASSQSQRRMMTEKDFEPITTQADFDQRIKARLAREKEKWQKQAGIEDLRSEIESKDTEMAAMKREVAVDRDLTRRGVPENRKSKIRRLIDMDAITVKPGGEIDPGVVALQVEAVAGEIPELFRVPGPGAASGGSSRPVFRPEPQGIQSRAELEGMSEREINARWSEVQTFLASEAQDGGGSAA